MAEKTNTDVDVEIKESTPAQSVTSARSTTTVTVLLLDDAQTFGQAQKDLLALAQALRTVGVEPHILCAKGGALFVKAQEENFTTVPLRLGLFGLVRLLWRYSRITPLCVHAFSCSCVPFIAKLVARRRPLSTLALHSCYTLPQALSPHASSKTTPARKVAAWKNIEKIILPSEYAVKAWEEHGLAASRTQIIYMAYEEKDFAHMPSFTQQQRCNFVVFTNLQHEEDLDGILKSMLLLQEQAQEKLADTSSAEEQTSFPFEVRVVGDGKSLEGFITKARGLGVEKHLALLGEQDVTDVLPYASVAIFPQAHEHEHISALLAAFYIGVPVIAVAAAPYQELAKGEMYFVPVEETSVLHTAMAKLMQDAELRKKYAQNSFAMHDFASKARLQKDYLHVYVEHFSRRGWPTWS